MTKFKNKKILLIWSSLLIIFGFLFFVGKNQPDYQKQEKKTGEFLNKEFNAYSLKKPEKRDIVEYFLEAKESIWKFSNLQPDSQKTKLWLYNNEIAPVLKIKKGQTLKVTLKKFFKARNNYPLTWS